MRGKGGKPRIVKISYDVGPDRGPVPARPGPAPAGLALNGWSSPQMLTR